MSIFDDLDFDFNTGLPDSVDSMLNLLDLELDSPAAMDFDISGTATANNPFYDDVPTRKAEFEGILDDVSFDNFQKFLDRLDREHEKKVQEEKEREEREKERLETCMLSKFADETALNKNIDLTGCMDISRETIFPSVCESNAYMFKMLFPESYKFSTFECSCCRTRYSDISVYYILTDCIICKSVANGGKYAVGGFQKVPCCSECILIGRGDNGNSPMMTGKCPHGGEINGMFLKGLCAFFMALVGVKTHFEITNIGTSFLEAIKHQ